MDVPCYLPIGTNGEHKIAGDPKPELSSLRDHKVSGLNMEGSDTPNHK